MLIDPAMLQMLKELRLPGQSDPVAEILQVFEADGKRMLGKLQLAATNHDAEALHSAAHRFKGSAANLGALQLQAELQVIETSSRDGTLAPDLDERLRRLPELFERSMSELTRLATDRSAL